MLQPLVYQATNKFNGHAYIGKTSRSLGVRKRQHRQTALRGSPHGRFHAAIRKYGWDAFEWSVLSEHATDNEALAAEMAWIIKLKPKYNATSGGENPIASLETRRKISKSIQGKGWSEERKAALRTRIAERPRAARIKKPSYAGEAIVPRTRRKWGDQNAKEQARLQALATKGEWDSKFRPLGPAASSRSVKCLDDETIYPSASAAARAYRASKSAIIELCNGRHPHRRTVAGRRFVYAQPTEDEVARYEARAAAGRRARLTEHDVRTIREMFLTEMTSVEIAGEYKVSPATIRDIRRGVCWVGKGLLDVPA